MRYCSVIKTELKFHACIYVYIIYYVAWYDQIIFDPRWVKFETIFQLNQTTISV